MNRIRPGVFAAAIAVLALSPALAQDYSQSYSDQGSRHHHRHRHHGSGRSHQGTPGVFDFYVLSLSWSPSFCESGGGRSGNNEQCDRERPYAFVVHGLWPQYERGFPENCAEPAPWIDSKLINSMLDLMPARKLVIHEWQAHGTCSGLDADHFFATVRSAREKIKIPERFVRLNDYTMVSPDEVEDAFVAANPGLAHDMIAVACNRRYLSEVRICMGKDLAFHACPETERHTCRNPRIAMPPVRGG
jgi:ribonuclease T2